MHLVELTQAGEAAFYRLREAAFAFNERLQAGFDEGELAQFRRILDRLRSNVVGEQGPTPREPSHPPGRADHGTAQA